MKLLVISTRFPFPLEKGDKLRLYHQIITLSQHFEVYLFSCSTEDVSEEDQLELSKFCKHIEIYELERNEMITSLAGSFFSGLPFQVGLYTNSSVKSKIDKLVKEFDIDHIYCQLIRMAENVKHIKLPMTIDYMDAFSFGMAQRKKKGSVFFRWIFGREANKVALYEKRIHEKFNTHTIITDQDKNRINIDDSSIEVIHNGVDVDYYINKGFMEEYDLVFIGNMGYIPNVNAAKFLTKKILPKLNKRADKEYTVFIAGARPTNEVIALTKDENVTVAGWLEDIRSGYESGRYFVAPIFDGMGQQNKVLEAMSMEKPCILNQEVADGIGLIHEKNCLVANTADEFVDSILRLEKDATLMATIIVNAKELVQKEFQWETQNMKLVELIQNSHGNQTN